MDVVAAMRAARQKLLFPGTGQRHPQYGRHVLQAGLKLWLASAFAAHAS
jgi:hypothetical protein